MEINKIRKDGVEYNINAGVEDLWSTLYDINPNASIISQNYFRKTGHVYQLVATIQRDGDWHDGDILFKIPNEHLSDAHMHTYCGIGGRSENRCIITSNSSTGAIAIAGGSTAGAIIDDTNWIRFNLTWIK